jgi:hypothetical protein
MSAEAIKASYRRALDAAGETVAIRRYAADVAGPHRPWFEVEVSARVTGYGPDELIGGIVQGDRKLIVLADDLIARQFPLPLRKGDKAIIRGRECNIEAPDDNTRRVQGVLIAYELQVRGL